MSASNPQANGQVPQDQQRRKVVQVPQVTRKRVNMLVALISSLISLGMHALLIFLVLQLNLNMADANVAEEIKATETRIEEEPEEELDLTNLDIGIDPKIETQYNVDRIEEVSVPGMVNPTEAVGIVNAPEAPIKTLPAPPGAQGTGAAMPDAMPGTGSMFGTLGGAGGIYNPGGIGGRSGSTRQKLVTEGGGNERSEAAVAAGLMWMALHQAPDGHWSLHEFNRYAREKPFPAGRVFPCNCDPGASRHNDIAGTGFGLLPFLGAGQTHRTSKSGKVDYSKTVLAGLKYLMAKQGQNGYFGGDMYAHGLCTIAMCEAYGMTSDPYLKASAQRAINYIVYAQDPAGGGWRYSARTPGDLSVAGWQMMGLKSGQMCGLNVPAITLKKAEQFVDSCEASNGGFGYMDGRGSSYTMSAVGLLCRQYMGVNPRNPKLLKGVQIIKAMPPGRSKNMYYEYYATQVMHHMGGDSWNYWNLGPDGKGDKGIRDLLVNGQYEFPKDGNKAHQHGSWDPMGSGHGNSGGRIMISSLSLLMLEVYYRHLPLYRRDLGVVKEMN